MHPRLPANRTAAAATWWLRRSTGRKARCTGLFLDFSTRALHKYAVEPLVVLALAAAAPLQPLSCYVIQRGVAVHRIGGENLAYDWVPHGPGGQDMWPQFHDHEYYNHFGGSRPQEEWPKWLRFCEVVGPMVRGAYQKASTDACHQGAERLIRAANHF